MCNTYCRSQPLLGSAACANRATVERCTNDKENEHNAAHNNCCSATSHSFRIRVTHLTSHVTVAF